MTSTPLSRYPAPLAGVVVTGALYWIVAGLLVVAVRTRPDLESRRALS